MGGRRWITAATRADVNEDFLTTGERAFASSVSSNPRPMRNYTYTRMHCRRVICTKAEAQERLTACRYISQPCYILPSISSSASPPSGGSGGGLEILHGHRATRELRITMTRFRAKSMGLFHKESL